MPSTAIGAMNRDVMKAARLGVALSMGVGVLLTSPASAQDVEQAPVSAEPVPSPESVAAREVAPAPSPSAPTPSAFQLADLRTSGGLTAASVARRAVETAPSLRRARAAATVAAAAVERTWSAFMPRVDLSLRYTRLSNIDQPPFAAAVPDSVFNDLEALAAMVQDPSSRALHQSNIQANRASSNFAFPVVLNSLSLQASASYNITSVLLRSVPAADAAEHLAEARRLEEVVERSAVAVRATEAYYGYVGARAALAVAESNIARLETHRERLTRLVDGGVAARLDLLRFDAQLAQARVGLERARGGVHMTEGVLRSLLHLPSSQALGFDEDLLGTLPPVDGDVDTWVDRSIRTRPEVAALRSVMSVQELTVDIQEASRWPQVIIAGNIELANPAPRVFPQGDRWGVAWDLSAIVQWSPNDYAATDQNVDEARAEIAATETRVDEIRDAARMEVTQALTDIRTARASREASEIAMRIAADVEAQRRVQLENGVVVMNDLLDAVSELTQARLGIVSAALDERVARARLARAIGETTPVGLDASSAGTSTTPATNEPAAP